MLVTSRTAQLEAQRSKRTWPAARRQCNPPREAQRLRTLVTIEQSAGANSSLARQRVATLLTHTPASLANSNTFPQREQNTNTQSQPIPYRRTQHHRMIANEGLHEPNMRPVTRRPPPVEATTNHAIPSCCHTPQQTRTSQTCARLAIYPLARGWHVLARRTHVLCTRPQC